MKKPQIKKKEYIYQGEYLSLKILEVEQEGEKTKGEVIDFPPTVGILVFIEEDEILLLKQFRLPSRKELWEIPAGKTEKGEEPEEAAKRELKEETGFKGEEWKRIGSFYVSPGYTTEYMHLFECKAGKKQEQELDKGEFIGQMRSLKIGKAWQMIREGEIKDGKTILALALNKLDYNLSRQ